jgi:hypothetical protein
VFNPIKLYVDNKLVIPDRPVTGLCQRCNVKRDFRLMERNTWRHFMYFYAFDREQSYITICPECTASYTLSVAQTQKILPGYLPPTPKYRQRLVLVVCILPLFAWLVFANVARWLQ